MEGYTMKLFMKNMIAAVALFAVIGVNTVDCAKKIVEKQDFVQQQSTVRNLKAVEKETIDKKRKRNDKKNNKKKNKKKQKKNETVATKIANNNQNNQFVKQNQTPYVVAVGNKEFNIIKIKPINAKNILDEVNKIQLQSNQILPNDKNKETVNNNQTNQKIGVNPIVNPIIVAQLNVEKPLNQEVLSGEKLSGVTAENKETVNNNQIKQDISVKPIIVAPLNVEKPLNSDSDDEVIITHVNSNNTDSDIENRSLETLTQPLDKNPNNPNNVVIPTQPVKKVKTTLNEKNVATVVICMVAGATLGSLMYPLSGNDARSLVFVVDGAVLGLAAGLIYVCCVAQK